MSKAQAKEQQTYPELSAVLDHQERIAGLSQQIKSIETAISGQEAKLAAARDGRPSTDALEQRRQDLFAAEALGHVTEAERQAQESEIDREAAQIKERFASTDQSITRMEAALSGLRSQREKASAQMQRVRAQTAELLERLIVAEAERACAAYVNATLVVKERYLQLMSLSDLLTRAAGDSRRPQRLRGYDAGLFFIPSFNLPQCAGTVHPNWPGRLASAELLDYSGAETLELDRLRALGVTLI